MERILSSLVLALGLAGCAAAPRVTQETPQPAASPQEKMPLDEECLAITSRITRLLKDPERRCKIDPAIAFSNIDAACGTKSPHVQASLKARVGENAEACQSQGLACSDAVDATLSAAKQADQTCDADDLKTMSALVEEMRRLCLGAPDMLNADLSGSADVEVETVNSKCNK